MRTSSHLLPFILASMIAVPALAQSPNTAAIVIVVVDQTGAVVSDANITVVNNATGATREGVSGAEGSATIGSLSLTGTYTVSVTRRASLPRRSPASRCAPAKRPR